jgi:hypothetical protein
MSSKTEDHRDTIWLDPSGVIGKLPDGRVIRNGLMRDVRLTKKQVRNSVFAFPPAAEVVDQRKAPE